MMRKDRREENRLRDRDKIGKMGAAGENREQTLQ